jgi:hypothetical protein
MMEEETPFWTLKDTLGLVVLCIGIFIGLWVFIQVWHLISDPGSMTAFQELMRGDFELAIYGPGEDPDLSIGREFLSYLIVVFLLMVALGVAKMFVTGGVAIMAGDWQNLVKKKFEGVEERLKEIGDSVRKQFPR